MPVSFNQIEDLLPFAFLAAGGILAVLAYFQYRRQRRREKALQLLLQFKKSVREHDLNHWKELYLGTSAAAAAPAGHFISREGVPVPLDSMWAEGGEDHTAIQRMAESFEKICTEILTEKVEIKTVWFEIGQLLSAMHQWLADIKVGETEITFLEAQYPSIKKVFEKYGREFKKWSYQIYAKI